MRLKLKRRDDQLSCYRCGEPLEMSGDTTCLLTRVDPHTQIERPLTPDELADLEQRRKTGSSLHLWHMGVQLSCVCEECKTLNDGGAA